MRELFDEGSGKARVEPEEAARRTTRGPRRKRFYANAGTVESPNGFAIALDDKPVRTPSGHPLVAPTREIADVIVAEWDAQKEIIDPLTMPMTRLPHNLVEALGCRGGGVAGHGREQPGAD